MASLWPRRVKGGLLAVVKAVRQKTSWLQYCVPQGPVYNLTATLLGNWNNCNILNIPLQHMQRTSVWTSAGVPSKCFTQETRGLDQIHYKRIAMASQWARWRLKSPASPLFAQPFIRPQIKENIKAPHHRPLCGEFIGETGELPAKKAVNAENVSIWWRRHGGKWTAKCNWRSSISLFKSSAPVQHIAITHSNDDMIANLTYYRASSVNVLLNRIRWYFNNDDKALVNLAVNLENWHRKYRCRTDTGHELVHQCPADVLIINMVDYQQETCWFKGLT